MKKLTIEQVEARIKQLAAAHKRRYLGYAKEYEGKHDQWSKDRAKYFAEKAGKYQAPISYKPRLKLFKDRNVCLNPVTMEGTSYNWWVFVTIINGKLVFNRHRYSVTTSKHQSYMRSLLKELGIKIDIEVDTRMSLDRGDYAVSEYLKDVYFKLHNARLHNADPAKRVKIETKGLEKAIKNCKTIGVTLSLAEVTTINEQAEESYLADVNRACYENSVKVTIVVDRENKHVAKAGLHINCSGYLSRWRRRQFTREAEKKGFTKVYIHDEPVRPELKLVSAELEAQTLRPNH